MTEEEEKDEELFISLMQYSNKYDIVRTWKLFDKVSREYHKEIFRNKAISAELHCPAIIALSEKKELNHKERMALLFIYLGLGKNGEERLMEILKRQDNYDENICRTQIENYEKKGKMLGISCEKLKEWNICHSEFSDCDRYEKSERKEEI